MKVHRSNIIFLACYGLWVAGIVLILGVGTSSCKSADSVVSAADLENLDNFLEERDYTFEVEFAMPTTSPAYMSAANIGFSQVRGSSVANINLIGEGYRIVMEGDSVTTQLPYFGTRDNVTSYNTSDMGIKIKGKMEEFQIKPWKKGREVSFFAQEEFERFRFLITVTPNLKTQVSVFSPQRDIIRYTGTLNSREE